MRARLTPLALVLGLALLAAGCGASSGPRGVLAGYIDRVDETETALRAPLQDVSRAGHQFAVEQQASAPAHEERNERAQKSELLHSAAKIEAIRARLAAITAPHEATHLRSMLLELIDRQLALTREVAKMVVFIPRYAAALAPLLPAIRRLEPALSARGASAARTVAAAYAAKAAALTRFAAQLQRILASLHALQPPAVSRPGYRAQVSSIEGMSTDARRLADALLGARSAEVPHILTAFDRAAASTQTGTAQRAQIAAVRTYDSQVTGLSSLSQSISDERTALANTLR